MSYPSKCLAKATFLMSFLMYMLHAGVATVQSTQRCNNVDRHKTKITNDVFKQWCKVHRAAAFDATTWHQNFLYRSKQYD